VAARQAAGTGPRAGATTLVVARLRCDGHAELHRVGDSTALVLADGKWQSVFAGDPDGDGGEELVVTATAALPAAEPEVETATVTLRPGEALVLLSDGVFGPLRDGPETVAPALAHGLADPVAPLTLATLADFSRRGCLDDRTIVAVWMRAPDIDPDQDLGHPDGGSVGESGNAA
ncbi:MAG: protein phosphatase 2C domain-containing protein, partial [Acidimicrobiales bacterium]